MAGQRVTQIAAEVLMGGLDTDARITQTAAEALIVGIDTDARVTQLAIEVLLDPNAVEGGFPWVNLPRVWLGAADGRSLLAPPPSE